MKKLFSLLFLVPALALAGVPMKDARLSGSSEVESGTFTVQSGASFVSAAGSTVNLSSGSVTLPAAVSLLGALIDLSSEVENSLPWASVDKTGSSLADLATRSAGDLSSGTVAVARLPVMVGDSGAGGTAGIVPAPGAGDAAAGKYLKADGTFAVPPGGSVAFFDITDVDPSSYSGQSGKPVVVNGTETGLEFGTPSGNATQIQGYNVYSTAPSDGQALVWVNANSRYEPQAPAGNATQLYGVSIDSSASSPSDGQALVYSSGTGAYVPSAPAGNATQLQGRGVASTAPTDGQVLAWNNTGSQWEPTTAGGGSGGTKTYEVWTAAQGQPPASNYAAFDQRNNISILNFDQNTDESIIFVGILPEGADVSSGLKVILKWTSPQTTLNCVWMVAFEKSTTDLDTDSFDTATSSTEAANATSGIPTSSTITATNIDSLTAGDLFRLMITRDADNASDNLNNDAELIAVELRSAN